MEAQLETATIQDEGHHHPEPFITKYLFSQDHKMIAKQFLITGTIMAFVGMIMSLLFRLQLAWPGESFGSAGAGHIRVALTIADDDFAAAFAQVLDFAAQIVG